MNGNENGWVFIGCKECGFLSFIPCVSFVVL